MSSSLPSRIAALALAHFDLLPAKSKPRVHPSGREWVPLSAIVLVDPADESLVCVSLATGTKCLPASKVAGGMCRGAVLHDCHAEMLALRGLNWFLLGEMEGVLRGGASRWVEVQANGRPFRLREGVSVHLFSTEAPCGDASMGLLSASMPPEDSAPWVGPTPGLHGRGYFSLLGAVRRKPGRGDAAPTLSKSCTDKLTVRQITSVLGFPACLFVERTGSAFLKSMVLPEDKYDVEGFERAFGPGGRLCGIAGSVGRSASLVVRYFDVETLPPDATRFAFEKVSSAGEDPSIKAGNVSALWIKGTYGEESSISETLVNGVKQGSKQFSESDFKMSAVCRKRMWQQGCRLAALLLEKQDVLALDGSYISTLEDTLNARTYRDVKEGVLDRDRRAAKALAMDVLGGWKRNVGDEDWGLQGS